MNVHNTSESKKPSEVGTQTSTGLTIPPLNLYRMAYCRSCPEAEFCKVSFEQHLLCLLAKIADDLARTRQILAVQECKIAARWRGGVQVDERRNR